MSKGTYPLELPASTNAAAARLAKEDGVSLNQWIATAVAQKFGVAETAAAFFRRRAGDATPDGLKRIMDKAPDVSPAPKDALPPHLADRLSRSPRSVVGATCSFVAPAIVGDAGAKVEEAREMLGGVDTSTPI